MGKCFPKKVLKFYIIEKKLTRDKFLRPKEVKKKYFFLLNILAQNKCISRTQFDLFFIYYSFFSSGYIILSLNTLFIHYT